MGADAASLADSTREYAVWLARPTTVALASAAAAGTCALPFGVLPGRKSWLGSAAPRSCCGDGSRLVLAAIGSAQAMLPASFRLTLKASEHMKLVLQQEGEQAVAQLTGGEAKQWRQKAKFAAVPAPFRHKSLYAVQQI